MNEPEKKLRLCIIQSIILLVTVLAIMGTLFCNNAFAEESTEANTIDSNMSTEKAGVMKFGLISAGIAFGLAAIGGGYAISHIGAAAMGAIAEKPQIAMQALIFVGLAEGVVVFGVIAAFIILGKV